MAAAALRRVQADCSIEIETNAYSVPWRLIGETVRVVVAGGTLVIAPRDQSDRHISRDD